MKSFLKFIGIVIFLIALIIGGFWAAIGTLVIMGIIVFIISL